LRYLILSDLHANWEALTAVLTDADGKYDSILCCGDVVGYGADPNRMTEWVRANTAITIRGNHDRACSSLLGIEWFNPLAQEATKWTHRELTAHNRLWLDSLPAGPAEIDGFTIVHGSPLDEDEYLLTVSAAADAFAFQKTALTFFGHTHIQGGFEHHRMKVHRFSPKTLGTPVTIDEHSAYLVNPGSVGQPRDSDPRAAYLVFETAHRTVEFRRVPYDIATAQKKIVEAGLPMMLAARLSIGE
jgi:diadenosine tetraphosphatase ApaH/serine/threonine PP2A family protein phosphatase